MLLCQAYASAVVSIHTSELTPLFNYTTKPLVGGGVYKTLCWVFLPSSLASLGNNSDQNDWISMEPKLTDVERRLVSPEFTAKEGVSGDESVPRRWRERGRKCGAIKSTIRSCGLRHHDPCTSGYSVVHKLAWAVAFLNRVEVSGHDWSQYWKCSWKSFEKHFMYKISRQGICFS